jgi:hypothetical protein
MTTRAKIIWREWVEALKTSKSFKGMPLQYAPHRLASGQNNHDCFGVLFRIVEDLGFTELIESNWRNFICISKPGWWAFISYGVGGKLIDELELSQGEVQECMDRNDLDKAWPIDLIERIHKALLSNE